ncbi:MULTISPECIES: hypothetical protein [unclassified Lentimicrobium]|uniref:hypothetical protein n=1 Tax=unclassified Lentimicrobium TaxID=2677434 RepID=UPI001552E6B3|nr:MULTISPECIES: hypothetical protein [unclassified Lentimicrobium]NPD43940.1 hypothetical protein [Lentimicrobium sp. S6]NPD84155.1 hypothetical protein [Lentimicrobium sp. L6]
MKLKDIYHQKQQSLLFDIIEENSEDPREWILSPKLEMIIPDEEAHCIVRAILIDSKHNENDCFMDVSLPERISDYVIFQTEGGLNYVQTYELEEKEVIPMIACEATGDYEMYYSQMKPSIGIEVLKRGLEISKTPSVIAEDLGYIYRDENRYQEALDAFLISDKNGVSNDYIYKEIHDLYLLLHDKEKAAVYAEKCKHLF